MFLRKYLCYYISTTQISEGEMMKIAICDDDRHELLQIAQLVNELEWSEYDDTV